MSETFEKFLGELAYEQDIDPLELADLRQAELQRAADLEQMQQEDALFPWLADGSMSDASGDAEPYDDENTLF